MPRARCLHAFAAGGGRVLLSLLKRAKKDIVHGVKMIHLIHFIAFWLIPF